MCEDNHECEEKHGSYHHGCLREALITATTEMLAEEGIDGVSMRKLSQRIGVSRTAAYRHFADKNELLAAVAEQGYKRLSESTQSFRQQNERDVIERLEEMCVGYIQFAAENPALYRLMFGPKITDWRVYPGLITAGREAMDGVIAIIELGQQQHRIKPGSAADLAYVLFALLHGQSTLLIDGRLRGQFNAGQPARLAVQVFLEGAGLRG